MREFRRLAFTLLLGAAAVLMPGHAGSEAETAAQAIHAALESGNGIPLSQQGDLRRFYGLRQDQPAWYSGNGLTEDGRAAVAAMAGSGSDGLDPSRYEISNGGSLVQRDMAFTTTVLRYISDIRSGHDEWRHLDRDVDLPPQGFDAASALARATNDHRVFALMQAMTPQWPAYGALKTAYAQYAATAAQGWPQLPGKSFELRSATPGQQELLRKRLAAEDQSLAREGEAASVQSIDAALRRYQESHGLAVDGKVGAATLAALNIPATLRRAQIAANMERLRWLPHAPETTYVLVNVPDASLELWSEGALVLTSRVIVGKPVTRTPVFRAEITEVIANPPWSVPISIARKEMLPKLRRNPTYLARNHIVVKGASGDPYGSDINWRDPASARYLPQLQQQPGDDNALGRLKLSVTDRFSVYLHDTPSRSLFARDNRFLSHGCIRVQEIGKLANFILNGHFDADDKTLDGAIAAATTKRFAAKTRTPVYVLYFTTFVARDGSLQFRNDIYDRDARLISAMMGTRYALAEPAGGVCQRPA